MTRTIMGIDPGVNMGWAVVRGDTVVAGVCTLGVRSIPGTRMVDLDMMLGGLFAQHAPSVVVCEHPVHGPGSHAIGLLHAIWYQVARHAYEAQARFIGDLYPATIKKTVAGHGNATKPQMIRAVQRVFPGLDSLLLDDNAYDAVAIVLAAEELRGLRK